MLDREKFIDKYSVKKATGKITNRICKYPVDIPTSELAKELASGKSFVPGYLGERNELNKYGNIARRISNWTSQQVICLDFDNEKEILENEKKIKIKEVTMTIDQAIDIFKDSAAFIYKSLSYSDDHPKFRVVFILDEPINNYNDFEQCMDNLLNAFPNADPKCKDGSRMFFGGSEYIEIDFSNTVHPEWSDEAKSLVLHGKKGFCVHVISRVFKDNYNVDKKTPQQNKTSIKNEEQQNEGNGKNINIKNNTIKSIESNIELIKQNKWEELRERIGEGHSRVRFGTHEEVYEYLKTRDLNVFMGLYGKFNCVFHKDGDPSADIYVYNKTGHYLYSCHSDFCTFNNGTVIKCVERALRCNKVEALRFLKKVYGIEYYETEWQKEQREIIDENIRYIRSNDFEKEYPQQFKLVKPYLDDLHTFLVLAKDNLPPQEYFDEQKDMIFYTSMRQFAKLKGYKDPRRLVDRLALFAYLCYTQKLSEDQIPDKLLVQAKRELFKQKLKGSSAINISSFFSIPSYSDETMTKAEEKAKQFYEHSLTMSNWGWEMLYRTFGKEEADRVYPQLSRKRINEIGHEHVSRIENKLMERIQEYGYAIEDDIVNDVEFIFGKDTYKRRQLKVAIGEILDKYGLVRARLNKKLKERLKYEGNGYPFVIMRKE